MIGLVTLGFTLSLDNFRTSLVLGGLKPSLRTSVKTSLIFGLWDGAAPLVGLILGQFLSERIDSTADMIAAAGLAAYGLFVVTRALVTPEHADPDLRWARRGLPVPLSIDNVAAGASLALAGYSSWLAPILFGVITFVMSVAGHQIGRVAATLHSSDPYRPADRDRVRRDGGPGVHRHVRRLTSDARAGSTRARLNPDAITCVPAVRPSSSSSTSRAGSRPPITQVSTPAARSAVGQVRVDPRGRAARRARRR